MAGRGFEDLSDRIADAVAEGFRKGMQQASDAGSRASTGSASPVPQVPSMGLESIGGAGGLSGLGLGNVASSIISGAGQGISKTPAGALSSPDVLAQNAGIGAVGGLIDSTAGNLPFVGDLIKAQVHAFQDAVRKPAESAEKSVGRQVGNLMALGYDVSNQEIDRLGGRALEVERNRLMGQRRAERSIEQLNAQNGVSFGLSSLGF